MVLPLSMGAMPPGPPPKDVVDARPMWMLLFGLLIVCCACRITGADFFGALLSGIMAGIVYYMTKDGFENMPRMIMMFGILCAFNTFFEILPLISDLRGRTEQKVEEVKGAGGEVDTSLQKQFTVTLETHPFFDASMGIAYNAQSFAIVLSPLTMIFGAVLSYYAFQAFSAMAPNVEEGQGGGGFGMGGFGLGANQGGYGGMGAAGGSGGNSFGGGGRVLGSQSEKPTFQVFGGEGHQLGK